MNIFEHNKILTSNCSYNFYKILIVIFNKILIDTSSNFSELYYYYLTFDFSNKIVNYFYLNLIYYYNLINVNHLK